MPLDVEVQLGGKAYRAQHAYRVFLVALLGVADQANQLIANVVDTMRVVEDALAARVVIQRVDGEVAALGVFFEGAVDVVAQDASAFVMRRLLVVGACLLDMAGAEGRYFDDFAAKVHMHQLEAPADHPGIAKRRAYLFRGGAGRYIEVLGGRPSSRSRTQPPTA